MEWAQADDKKRKQITKEAFAEGRAELEKKKRQRKDDPLGPEG